MTIDEFAAFIRGAMKDAVAPLAARLSATETTIGDVKVYAVEEVKTTREEVKTTRETVLELAKAVGAVEARPPVPGPPGPPGADGKDGLGLEELDATVKGRVLTFTLTNGTRTKTIAIELTGLPVYQGTYTETKTYVVGDLVTSDRAVWTCQQPTSAHKPGTSPHWRLFVSRDGR